MDSTHHVTQITELVGDVRSFDERTDRLRKGELREVAEAFGADIPDNPTRRDLVRAIQDARGRSTGMDCVADQTGYTVNGLQALLRDLRDELDAE